MDFNLGKDDGSLERFVISRRHRYVCISSLRDFAVNMGPLIKFLN